MALEHRNALSPALHESYSRTIAAKILALPEFREAATVMAYGSFGSEFDTLPILQAIIRQEKKLVLPKVNRAAGFINIFQIANLETDLQPGVWGIPEPDPDRCPVQPVETLDLIVVPGVAFDRKGGRIGHGKAYYDKFLSACHAPGHHSHTVAGAFEAQIVDEVPMESHDVRIELLVTEAGTWRSEGAKSSV